MNEANRPILRGSSDEIAELSSEEITPRNSIPMSRKQISFMNEPHAPLMRREKEPDKFDGKSVDWQDYIVHFEQTARWNHWSEIEMAQQLSISLRGTAQKLLGDAKPEILNNYNQLKEMLNQRFAPKERVTAYRVEFNSRMRKKNESLSDYGYALRRLSRLAYPNHHMTEDLAIDQFIRGLENFELQKRVQFSHPSTLESAIAVAIEYEAFVGSTCEVRKPKLTENEYPVQSIKKSEVKASHKTEKDNSDLVEFSKTLMEGLQELKKKIDEVAKAMPIQCTRCTRYGHNYTECKVPKCSKCKKMGHVAKNCRSNQNRNKTDQSNESQTLNHPGLGSGPRT